MLNGGWVKSTQQNDYQVEVIKTVDPWFGMLWDGSKTAELRLDDRNYQPKSIIVPVHYPDVDRFIIAFVGSVISFPSALKDGWVMISLVHPIKFARPYHPDFLPQAIDQFFTLVTLDNAGY